MHKQFKEKVDFLKKIDCKCLSTILAEKERVSISIPPLLGDILWIPQLGDHMLTRHVLDYGCET